MMPSSTLIFSSSVVLLCFIAPGITHSFLDFAAMAREVRPVEVRGGNVPEYILIAQVKRRPTVAPDKIPDFKNIADSVSIGSAASQLMTKAPSMTTTRHWDLPTRGSTTSQLRTTVTPKTAEKNRGRGLSSTEQSEPERPESSEEGSLKDCLPAPHGSLPIGETMWEKENAVLPIAKENISWKAEATAPSSAAPLTKTTTNATLRRQKRGQGHRNMIEGRSLFQSVVIDQRKRVRPKRRSNN